MRQGHRAYQFVMPRPGDLRYTLKTAQHFDAMATWKNVMLLPLEQRKEVFRDPATRAKLHREAVETPMDTNRAGDFTRRWDLQFVFKTALAKNQHLTGKSLAEIAREQNKDVLDAFLDLALEENLETEFERREVNSDQAAMTALLTSPYTVIGQSDGGAHVVFRTDYSYSTYLLSHWVREKEIMSLEERDPKAHFRAGLALRIFRPRASAPRYGGGLDGLRSRDHQSVGTGRGARPAGRRQAPQTARSRDRVDRGERASAY